MLHTVERVNGPVLWANMHLLFWLSLARFSTSWMDETHGAAAPTALYGFTLLMPGVAYRLLQDAIIRLHGTEHSLAQAVGQDWKGWLSLAGYCTAIAAAFFQPWISWTIYALVAVVWFIPDRRIERVVVTSDRA